MEILKFQNLLNQVTAISDRYKKINDLTGENFNVFRILKLESSEVRMHSAFIAELLNPQGSHGQKDTFLKIFAELFCFKGDLIDTPSCNVKIEEHIGLISKDKTQGGRIDIVITDKNHNQIIIENKIYANDQDFQLTRYYNYSNSANIIYLTLYGKSPSKESKRELEEGVHYKCYSYKRDILNWLQQCRKEMAVFPIIREGLTHYINSIKYLTNQTLNQNMQDELGNLLASHLEASFAIRDNLNKAYEIVLSNYNKLITQECQQLGLRCKYAIDFQDRYTGIWIYKPEWKYVNIGFQFQNYNKELLYGIVTKNHPVNSPIPNDVRANINELPNNNLKKNAWWPWFNWIEAPYDNWSNYLAWKAINNGSMAKMMIEKINHLLSITKGLEM